MNAVRHWLEEIGLGQYATAFEVNDIDVGLLGRLDDLLPHPTVALALGSAGPRPDPSAQAQQIQQV
jgi:hypothetical protein